MDRFIQLALVAAVEAVEDSGWMPEDEEGRCATGVMIGSGIGGLQTIHEASRACCRRPHRADLALLHPLGADQPGLRPRLDPLRLQGPEPRRGDGLRHRRACARRRGAPHRLRRRRRDGRRRGRGRGLRDRHGGLLRVPRALHRLQRHPAAGLPPLGRGPRRLRHGRGRRRHGARGTRTTRRPAARRSMARSSATACRATPTTSPPRPRPATAPSAPCGRRCATPASQPAEVQYVNAHGTSTPLGDDLELERGGAALGRRRRSKLAMSSTKSAIGHLLGAAGAVEGVFSVLAIRDKVAPPTLNLEKPSARA